MAKRVLTYPFVPRSTTNLVPGQFWAIPLSDETFACGRVIELAPLRSSGARVIFLAGLLDWHAATSPTAEAIAGAPCLDQGFAHLKTITETGGSILGCRPLQLDGIEPWEFRGATYHLNSHVHRGVTPIRPQQLSDAGLPVLSTWGFHVPVVVAEMRWVKDQR